MRRLVMLTAIMLGACTMGPDYRQPVTATPDRFTMAVGEGGPEVTPDTAWWRTFGDPVLVQLVEEAVAGNLRLAEARARIVQARALERGARGGLKPGLTASADYRRFRASEDDVGGVSELNEAGLVDLQQDVFQTGIDASWEIDLFGGRRRRIERAEAQSLAASFDARALRLSVIAEVARTYMDVRGAQARLDTLKRLIALQADLVRLAQARLDTGLAPKLDLARAEARLERTRADLPPARQDLSAGIFRLSVLAGRPPAALRDQLARRRGIPLADGPAPAGQPAQLLQRRPDLRAAEAKLQAAVADVGAQIADLYPRFFLIGSAGLEATDIGNLFDIASGTFTVGPSVTLPIFQGGRNRSEIEAAKAERHAATARYQQSVLAALEDVEAAYSGVTEAEAERRQLRRAFFAADTAYALAETNYQTGLVDLTTLLDAEREVRETDLALIGAQVRTAQAKVRLYRALGGGWAQPAPDKSTPVSDTDPT